MEEIQRRQVEGMIRKQKKIIQIETNEYEKAMAFGMWGGFLAGLRLEGLVSRSEYNALYEEMEEFQKLYMEDVNNGTDREQPGIYCRQNFKRFCV